MENKFLFNELFHEGKYKGLSYLADSKLVTEDGCLFDVHRFVLGKENRYFRSLYKNFPQNSGVILIPRIRGKILDKILCYLYTGDIPIISEDISELLFASRDLFVTNLNLHIQEFLKDNIAYDNCIPAYIASVKIGDGRLQKQCYRFIQTNFERILSNDSVGFGDIPLESLQTMLKDNSLCVSGEHVVWSSIVKWVYNDPSLRLSNVYDLLSCLKMADVEKALAAEILQHNIVSNNPVCKNEENSKFQNNVLDVLKDIATNSANSPESKEYSHRIPPSIHLIARYNHSHETESFQLFVTYDENVDIWRKLVGTRNLRPLSLIGLNIFAYDDLDKLFLAFNLYSRKWSEIPAPRITRRAFFQEGAFFSITLQKRMFLIGGMSNEGSIFDVEFYNVGESSWLDAAPMQPSYQCKAVLHKNRIFVVGKQTVVQPRKMNTQFYDPDSDVWSTLPSPTMFRSKFAFIGYHDKLYIIGGRIDSLRYRRSLTDKVEVFDFEENNWRFITDLPQALILPHAFILNDQLVVYDSVKGTAFRFKEEGRIWDLLKPLPKHMKHYKFFSTTEGEAFSMFVKENRDPDVKFEECLMNDAFLEKTVIQFF